jgi:upstream activation factor subunit UAF30
LACIANAIQAKTIRLSGGLSTENPWFMAKTGCFSASGHCQAGGFALSIPQHKLKREGSMAEGRQSGLQRPVKPSADLAAITGPDPLPRSQVVSKVWDHIKKNNLQNPQNKREIVADDKLKKIFGKDRCSMFEMNKHLSRHLS